MAAPANTSAADGVRLSATIITFNEEKHIRRCLASLTAVADEIVVVDSHSTDETESICRSFGATFIRQKFLGHVEQKNFALGQATFDHVLSLDADEVLSPELIKAIQEVKKSWTADAYRCRRRNNFCGRWIRHGLWYPDKKVRLWKKDKGKWGGVNPHDRIELETGARAIDIDGDLLHYTVDTVQAYVGQLNKFSSIQADNLRQKGVKPHVGHLLLKPLYKFFLAYFFRLGFLDGWRGFCIASGQAWGVYLRYAKLKENDR